MPSFQDNLSTLDGLRRQLLCSAPQLEPPHEKRYPYLDLAFLEFMYAIPREQLVRPGQRRSLMRRALVGIVPDELLNRKRKAFVARGPLTAVSNEWLTLKEMTQHMVSSSFNVVAPDVFSEALLRARQGQVVPTVTLIRTLAVELWLRSVRNCGILSVGNSIIAKNTSHVDSEEMLIERLL